MNNRIDVAALRALLDKATPGPWRWSENGNIVPEPYTDIEIAAVYTERDDDLAPANAELIIAAVTALPELLRVYQAVADAPEVDVYEMNDGRIVTDAPGLLNGQRVRLVPTSGEVG